MHRTGWTEIYVIATLNLTLYIPFSYFKKKNTVLLKILKWGRKMEVKSRIFVGSCCNATTAAFNVSSLVCKDLDRFLCRIEEWSFFFQWCQVSNLQNSQDFLIPFIHILWKLCKTWFNNLYSIKKKMDDHSFRLKNTIPDVL